jgi:hypothetical protein
MLDAGIPQLLLAPNHIVVDGPKEPEAIEI